MILGFDLVSVPRPYINLFPFCHHTVLTTGDWLVDFMTMNEDMKPPWQYAQSGGHGSHNFRLGCAIFSAEFRYKGRDAGEDLVYMQFTRDQWMSQMTRKEIYNGRIINKANGSVSRVVSQIILCSWCEYEPIIQPVMRAESRVELILRDNMRGMAIQM